MSDPINIPEDERGVVRIFAVDLPKAEIEAFTGRNGRWPLAEAMGANHLDAEYIDVFDLGDLAGMGLAGYLEDGQGIPKAQIDPMRAQLSALSGTVLVATSRAFAASAQTLTPKAPLRYIATFTEERGPVAFEPLPKAPAGPKDAKPPRKKPSDAAMSGRVATVVLLVLAALVTVMVWIA